MRLRAEPVLDRTKSARKTVVAKLGRFRPLLNGLPVRHARALCGLIERRACESKERGVPVQSAPLKRALLLLALLPPRLFVLVR